jgi:hypothetical protein
VKAAVYSSFLALGVLGARTASAYRPFEGTDGDVAEQGEFELELGPLHYAQEGEEKFFLTPTVLNLGVIPRMELVLDFVPLYPQQGGPTQVTDTDVFAKYLFRRGVLQEETGPSIAVEAGPLIPEVNGERGFGASANLIVSERWGWLTVHLNNEAQLSRKDLNFGWSTSLIGEAEFGAPIRPVAELTWETEPSASSNTFFALAGGIWNVGDGFDVDAAGRIGSVDGERALEVRLGLTWAIYLWNTAEDDDAPSGSVVGSASH